MPRFRDIPKFTPDGEYATDAEWGYLIEKWLPDQLAEGLNLDPDFQRGHVWTEQQQTRYIEFALRGGKTGKSIYFNHPQWMGGFEGEMVIVDGKQRLEAVRRFMKNEIKAFGYYFNEYTDNLRLTSARLRIHVNTLQTRAEVLQWYIDLNAGGVVHSDEEIQRVRELLAKEPGEF